MDLPSRLFVLLSISVLLTCTTGLNPGNANNVSSTIGTRMTTTIFATIETCTVTAPNPIGNPETNLSLGCAGYSLSTYTSTVTAMVDVCGPTDTAIACTSAVLSTYSTIVVTTTDTCTQTAVPRVDDYSFTFTSSSVALDDLCGDLACSSTVVDTQIEAPTGLPNNDGGVSIGIGNGSSGSSPEDGPENSQQGENGQWACEMKVRKRSKIL